MDFPLASLMDEQACYDRLVSILHPGGFPLCPRCGAKDQLGVHRRHRAPILDYACKRCRHVFNAFTATALAGRQLRPAEALLFLRGVAQGVSTAQLARELGKARSCLLDLRHKLQAQAEAALDRSGLPDQVVEADQMYVNAGEKRRAARRPRRPAKAAGQPGARARHLREGPAAPPGGGRPRERPAAAGGDRARRRGHAVPAGGGLEPARGAGAHRRLAGVQPPGPHTLPGRAQAFGG